MREERESGIEKEKKRGRKKGMKKEEEIEDERRKGKREGVEGARRSRIGGALERLTCTLR